MSARSVETVLARLYSEPEFREAFLKAPVELLRSFDLTSDEMARLFAIDREGLVLAGRSYDRKRIKYQQFKSRKSFFSRVFR